jgi:hypothetical protein
MQPVRSGVGPGVVDDEPRDLRSAVVGLGDEQREVGMSVPLVTMTRVSGRGPGIVTVSYSDASASMAGASSWSTKSAADGVPPRRGPRATGCRVSERTRVRPGPGDGSRVGAGRWRRCVAAVLRWRAQSPEPNWWDVVWAFVGQRPSLLNMIG